MSGTFGAKFFDAKFYLSQNPDVLAALLNGQISSAFDHFQNNGRFEGRSPNANFNPKQYLIDNADVLSVVLSKQIASAWDHFVKDGVLELRSSGTFAGSFNDAAYLAANADVAAAVLSGTFANGYQHYLLYGQHEGRAAFNFMEAAYLRLNPDVAAAVQAGDLSSGYQHYVLYGLAEGRIGTGGIQINPIGVIGGFNEAAYLAAHPDVAKAVQDGVIANGFEHYKNYGQAEGRVAFNMAGDQINAKAPIFTLTSSTATVDEGNVVLFTLQTTNTAVGAAFDYTISGVSAADVEGGQLSGRAFVAADGKVVISVRLTADGRTEGPETLTLTVAGQAQSVIVNDTSVAYTMQQALTLALAGDFPAEGVASYTLSATKFNAGDLAVADAQVAYQTALSIIGGAQNAASLTLANLLAWGIEDTAANILAAKATPVVVGASTVSLAQPTNPVNVATAAELVALPNFDDAYTLADTLENLAAASAGLVESALSYALTNAPGQLPNLTAARWELAQGATNAADYPQTFTLTLVTPGVATDEVDEGDTVQFELTSQNGVPGTSYVYNITGVDASDIGGAPLSGSVVLNASGQAVIEVRFALDGLSELTETLTLTVAGQTQSVVVNDVPEPIELTTGQDNVQAGLGADLITGARASAHLLTGEVSTYNPGDVVNGGGGSNTLRLFMDQGAIADGVAVSNIQQLDLRLNASTGGAEAELVMTDWDSSLQQIDILSNKSRLEISEQKTVADISIRDLSTVDTASSYDFYYAAGVLNGSSDALNLGINNVNGTGGANVTLDGGLEAVQIGVNDRQGPVGNANLYSSNINLNAAGVADITVTAGREGQTFTLNADVKSGADFDSTAFAGNMNLTSGDIRTARLGAGDDVVTLTGQANLADSSYALGGGNNRFEFAGTLGGDVSAESGNDRVTVGATSATSSIAMGDGDNIVTILGGHAGGIEAGSGNDEVTAASTAVGSSIKMGDGENTVTISGGHAGGIEAGSGDDEVTAASTAVGSSIEMGDGENTVTISGGHEGDIAGGVGTDIVSVGSTAVGSSVALGDGDNRFTVNGAHAGEFTAGSGDDTVTVGSVTQSANVVGGAISTGDGTDSVAVWGDVINGSINVGGGNDNTVIVTGSVIAGAPGTITFGDGDNNTLTIGQNLNGDAVVFGDGMNNSFTIGNDVTNGASITLGDGGNTGTIEGDVLEGSQVGFGSGADSLTVGAATANGLVDTPELSGIDTTTVIDMGAGNDQVTLLAEGHLGAAPTVVQSGAAVRGGLGNDTLTLRAENDTNLIARDLQQNVDIDFSGETFVLGQVVTVSFARDGQTFSVSHTVGAGDFIQGPDNVATTVANSVATALNANGTFQSSFSASAGTGVVSILSDNPHQDFAITSTRGVVDVVQISDARISSFETVELEAVDSAGVDNTTIQADFALIDGTSTVMLDSQVARDKTSAANAPYETFQPGGVSTFDLDNLKGGEAIHVAGHEASATESRNVTVLTVGDDDNDHLIGDKLTVTVDGVRLAPYVVTAANLSANTAELDANNIAQSLAAHITSQLGPDSAWDVVVQDNEVHLIGGSGQAVSVTHTRDQANAVVYADTTHAANNDLDVFTNLLNGSGQGTGSTDPLLPMRAGDVITVTMGAQTETYTVTDEDCSRLEGNAIVRYFADRFTNAEFDFGTLDFNAAATVRVTRNWEENIGETFVSSTGPVQVADANTDDAVADVVIDARLAAGVTDTTMDLTIDGHGHFDIGFAGNNGANGYTDLDLKLGDTFNHHLDMGGDDYAVVGATGDIRGNLSNSITVSDVDGVDTAGQHIDLGNVLARDVDTTGSAADFTIDQYSGVRSVTPADFEGETINIATGDGDDRVVTLAQSAMADGSSIDLGEGRNTLSLGWGDGVALSPLADQQLSWGPFNGTKDGFFAMPEMAVGTQVQSGMQLPSLFRGAPATWGDEENFRVFLEAGKTYQFSFGAAPVEGGATPQAIELFMLTKDHIDGKQGSDVLSVPAWSGATADKHIVTVGPGSDLPYVYNPGNNTSRWAPLGSSLIEPSSGDIVGTYIAEHESASLNAIQLSVLVDMWVSVYVYNDKIVPAGFGRFALEVFENNGPMETSLQFATPAQVFEAEEVPAPSPLDFSGMNFSGNLAELELQNDVQLGSDLELVVPGAAANLEALHLTNLTAFDAHDLTVIGAADDFRITSEGDFELGWPGSTAVQLNMTGVNLGVGTLVSVGFAIGDDLSFSVNHTFTAGQTGVSWLRHYLNTNSTFTQHFQASDSGDVITITPRNPDLDFTVNSSLGTVAVPPELNSAVGLLTAQNAAGQQITGDLTVEAGDDVLFDIGNAALASLNVDAGGNARVGYSGQAPGAYSVGAVNVAAEVDAEFRIQNAADLDIELGDVAIAAAGDDATLRVADNDETDVTLGSLEMEAADELSVRFEGNTASSLTALGALDLHSGDDVNIVVDDNLASDVEVVGDLTAMAHDDAKLYVTDNTRTNVSLSEDGTVTLIACPSDGYAEVDIAGNLNDYDPFGNGPDMGADFARTYTIALGDLVMDAGDYTVLNIDSNLDETYFGDLVIDIGNIDMLAHDGAEIEADFNLATTIVLGDVDMLSRDYAAIEVFENDGRVYRNQWNNNNWREEVDYFDITFGDVTMQSRDYGDVVVRDNVLSRVTAGDIQVTSLTSSATVDIDDNIDAHVDAGDITLDASGIAVLNIRNNESGADKFAFYSNAALVGRSTVEIGAVDMLSRNNYASMKVNTNNDLAIDTGAVNIVSYWFNELWVKDNIDSDVTIAGGINALSETDTSELRVENNFDGSVIVQGAVNLVAENFALFSVLNNDFTAVEFGTRNSPFTGADINVTANTGSAVAEVDDNDGAGGRALMGDVTVDAAEMGAVLVRNNDDHQTQMGDVDIDAGDVGVFNANSNDRSTVSIGNITIDAARIGGYVPNAFYDSVDETVRLDPVSGPASGSWISNPLGFDVHDNEDSTIELGNVSLTASGEGGDSDVAVRLSNENGLADNTIETGNFTARADSDVHFIAINQSASGDRVLATGDIALTSGLQPATVQAPDVSSDLYFRALGLTGNSANNDTQSITLTANKSGNGEGNVFAFVEDAADLNLLTVSGTNAEIYLQGTMGPGDSAMSTFTLDLRGMTGTFGGDSDLYNPLGRTSADNKPQSNGDLAGDQLGQDDGSYVVTTDAVFDGESRDVVIRIGTGDLIYNAQHSSFMGAGPYDQDETPDLEFTEVYTRDKIGSSYLEGYDAISISHVDYDYGYDYDWSGEEGWYSLGLGLTDLEATPQLQTIGGFRFDYGWDGWDVDEGYHDTITLDFTDGTNMVISHTGYFNGGADLYDVAGHATSLTDEGVLDLIVARTGATSAAWDFSGTLLIYGPHDGSAMANQITSATATYEDRFFDDDFGGGNWEYFLEAQPLTLAIDSGVEATDGVGNQASEVFRFEGNDIGEIVIGGFRPNGVAGLSGLVDYLDFSQFAGVTQRSDLVFMMDDSDGYFQDLIIDFVDQNLGSIRLVGVGEYYNLANEFASSGSIIGI